MSSRSAQVSSFVFPIDLWYAWAITIVLYPFLVRCPYKSLPLLMTAIIKMAYKQDILRVMIKLNDSFSPRYPDTLALVDFTKQPCAPYT
jgi:hypothetical protein